MTKSSQTFRISVVPTRKPRTRKPDPNHQRKDAQRFANQLLELLHDPQISNLGDQELFVSVVASAVQDLQKV